ncbi:MAG: GH92 family glycosyl hydrolase [Prevotella sp.]|nr:GH92 family glycosyl hydrolase [Prevotella sp.]
MERAQSVWQYVDSKIGSVGVGRTFPGPCMPFGMVKPGPDCGVLPNAGWSPMPEPVLGFSQTHVSGTGGGQKYGNILIQPFLANEDSKVSFTSILSTRKTEEIALGYYSTTYDNGIRTEITTDERCAYYRFHYPQVASKEALFIDCTHFLGKDSIPDLRERQQFIGAELEITSPSEVLGFTRIRGGWNNGDAYTVYFALQTDKPFTSFVDKQCQRAHLIFQDSCVNVKIGISYVSAWQARKNIPDRAFDQQLDFLRKTWDGLLSKVQIEGTEQQKRMFYTALYHTMLMPVDKTGENPKWTDTPYYDDYYAIWDTYRTSSPLLTLLCPKREVEIVNSLLNIYAREGYMPDARSGDCNGRTQGGSNAEIVIADAFVKGLQGIDYGKALEAMLKDATVPPGGNEEKEGRGGLREYNALGYIPYGIDRAGNRTIEYAFDDYCIATVAKGLGRIDIDEEYLQKSKNWRNLWRTDYEWDGMKGFIMPKDAQGRWLDSVPWGRSKVFHPQIPYTPTTKVAPWYLPWWSTFFYEATSEEYSLSIPHDVEGLIDACGGDDAFRQRLDLFFEKGYYNVQNEPSFLTPCLYHWIGRPDLSSQRIHQIIRDNYSDAPDGLPGNDDSGAMSSWMVFHFMGLYPNAGHDYYLLNVPILPEYTMTLSNGKRFHVIRKGKGDGYKQALWNGEPLPQARLTHQQIMQGGTLLILTSPTNSISAKLPISPINPTIPQKSPTFLSISYTLNRQFRTWPLSLQWENDTLIVTCKQTVYHIPRHEVEHATGFSWLSPQTDGTVYHQVKGTFAFVSTDALAQLKEKGFFVYDDITWRKVNEDDGIFHVRADIDRTEMWISTNSWLPFVVEMRNNPLGIDWKMQGYEE